MRSYIEAKVKELTDEYNTRNPFEILKALGISVEYNNEFSEIKGFFTIVNERPFAVINSNLPYEEQRIVAAHELGHSVLHKHFAKDNKLCETMLYDMKSQPEFEANLFAAYLLISDNEIKEAAALGFNKNQLAAYLNINEKLLDIR